MRPNTPEIDDDVLQQMIDHAGATTDREVGGVLIGSFEEDSTRVHAVLPALKADSARAKVTFTHEVWTDALNVVDHDYPELRIVGWYHSHPGFGIFLSSYDRFIQEHFFSDAGMVAFVVDPHSGENGWFGWVEGEIVRIDAAGAEPERLSPVRVSARKRIAMALALLAAASAGWFLRPLLVPDRPPSSVVEPGREGVRSRDDGGASSKKARTTSRPEKTPKPSAKATNQPASTRTPTPTKKR